MTTTYTVVGQHRTVPGCLLLLGDDNRYYARTAAGRPTPVAPTAAWVLDADREPGLDTAPVAAAPVAWHSVAARGASRRRPQRALAIVLALILGVLLAAPTALAHAPAPATTTAERCGSVRSSQRRRAGPGRAAGRNGDRADRRGRG